MFEILDWNPNTGLKWRVETSGDAARATGTLPFRAITICITIVVGRVKSADWADHACQYQYWWILMAVCGCRKNCSNHVVAHFRPVVTKIICICSIQSWLVNFHCLTQILTIKLMQQMGSDNIGWWLLTCLRWAKLCTCPTTRTRWTMTTLLGKAKYICTPHISIDTEWDGTSLGGWFSPMFLFLCSFLFHHF